MLRPLLCGRLLHMNTVRDIVILGSGPAGLTAAIYAARANLKPLVVRGPQPGGQLTLTSDVENWPGYEEGIMGPALMVQMEKQAERFGAEYMEGWVTDVDVQANPKVLTLEGGETIQTRALIIATGASAIWLGVPGEKELQGKGVSACATCDGFFCRDKKVVVVGGGDAAMEEATFLTKFANAVVVVHRRDELRASKAMQEKAFANKKITFEWNAEVMEVLGRDVGRVTGVNIKNNQTSDEKEVACDGYLRRLVTSNTDCL